MKEMRLKRKITTKMLRDVGFIITESPTGIFAVRAKNPLEPDKAVVIQLKGGMRVLKWRYASQDGKPLAPEVNDIEHFFETDAIYDVTTKKNIGASWHSEENRIEMKLNTLAMEIHKNAVAHGWWDEQRSIGDIVALIHTEVSEAFEEFRNGKDYVYYENGKPEGVAIELIDAVIRIFDFLAYQGIDIYKLMVEKHEYNKTRPYKHGGKKL